MIAHLKGRLVEKNVTSVVIECNGVGYEVKVSLNTYSELKDESVHLYTHLVVREDAHLLFGFADKVERDMFLLLISVNGVGANTALMILSSLKVEEVATAIGSEDVNLLKSIKGIGGKTAERIIVDLKDKMPKLVVGGEQISPSHNTNAQEALSALTMLGFAKNVAEKALQKTIQETGSELPVEELVKHALRNL